MTMSDNRTKHSQIEGLATLLVLNDEIRKLASIREFGFYSTNETHHLIPYHTAYLWQPKAVVGIEIVAQSGIAEIDEHAPANQWLIGVIKKIRSSPEAKIIHTIDTHQTQNDVQGGELNLHKLNPDDEFADHLLWCPFLSKSNELLGGLILFRETTFSEDEIKMITWLIASLQYTWHTLQKQRKTAFLKSLRQKPYLIAMLVAIIVILLFPTRLTVFGTGSVVPKNPVLINAPMQGVIKSFTVDPGAMVKPGQLLLTLDKTDLQSDVEVNKRDLLLTQAKLRSAINEGFSNDAARSEVPLLRAQQSIDQAHLDYTNSLLDKTEITSPAAGIVVFDSKEDWIGQPIQTGERILVVADPNSLEVKISLPVTNFMQMQVGDVGNFYIYGRLSPLPIKIRTLGYNAEILPNKALGYQLIADFVNPDDKPQLGSQGNVEIYGRRVPFIYYILRRPIQAARLFIGL